MPISVKTTFAQEGVFFAGEKLNCTIIFTNTSSPSLNNTSRNNTHGNQHHHQQHLSSSSRPSSLLPPAHNNNSNNNNRGNLSAAQLSEKLAFHHHNNIHNNSRSPLQLLSAGAGSSSSPATGEEATSGSNGPNGDNHWQGQSPSTSHSSPTSPQLAFSPEQSQPNLQGQHRPASTASASTLVGSTGANTNGGPPRSSVSLTRPTTDGGVAVKSANGQPQQLQSLDEKALPPIRPHSAPGESPKIHQDQEGWRQQQGQQDGDSVAANGPKQPKPATAGRRGRPSVDALTRQSLDQHDRQFLDQDEHEDSEREDVTVSAPIAPAPVPDQRSASSLSIVANEMTSSPGLLGLASFVYRTASFSSLASALGMSGNNSDTQETRSEQDEKSLPPIPPQEFERAGSTQPLTMLPPTEILSPDPNEQRLDPMGNDRALPQLPETPPMAKHSRRGSNSSTVNGTLDERMLELQVTDDTTDTHSVVDDTESVIDQTPRPSMDYSTRSSMQSIRGPFNNVPQESLLPRRRSSLMSASSSSLQSPMQLHQQPQSGLHHHHHSQQHHGAPGGPKSESILWGSVQVLGQFIVDGSFIRQQDFEPLKSKTMYRATGSSGGGAIGGGTLGQATSQSSTYSDWRERAAANRLFPVFSTPPSILFVDLQLAPGESASYSYQLDIPQNLPPSHRGKTIRFAYNLVLGVQRGSVHTPAKSVQLPFRLYNNISDLGALPVYDLLSPVIMTKDTSVSGLLGHGTTSSKVFENPKLARKQFQDYVDELVKSIKKQQSDSLEPEHNTDDSTSTTSSGGRRRGGQHTREMTRRESDAYKDEDLSFLLQQTCLQRISNLSRSASSASFDICKNNIPVAKLILTKTRFKLGETIQGVVSFTARQIPTYQISVTLETVEAIEPQYACRSAAQTGKLTKKIHAEMHESCIDTVRTSFALCIPPFATAEFKTSALSLKWYIRVEFMTGTLTPISNNTSSSPGPGGATSNSGRKVMAPQSGGNNVAGANNPVVVVGTVEDRFKMTSIDERRSQHQAVEQLNIESFDCSVPIKVFPTSFGTGAVFPATNSFTLV